MWIVTEKSGLINADHVYRFTENNCGTHAYCHGAVYMVSSDHVMATIIEALKNRADFVEVK